MYPDTGHLIRGGVLYVPRHRALDPERGYGEGEGDYMYPDTGHLIQREGVEKGRGIICTQTQGT